MDARAHAAANRAVGNPPGAAALECTVAGPSLLFLAPARFAVTGGDLDAVLERADLGLWPVPPGASVLARPGNVLRFAGRRSGCRAYVASRRPRRPRRARLALDRPAVRLRRLRGTRLRAGDRLAVVTGRSATPGDTRSQSHSAKATVRVVLGPQADHFAPETLARFLAEAWRVGATSDRVGCRFEGEPLPTSGGGDPLRRMVPGSIQVHRTDGRSSWPPTAPRPAGTRRSPRS